MSKSIPIAFLADDVVLVTPGLKIPRKNSRLELLNCGRVLSMNRSGAVAFWQTPSIFLANASSPLPETESSKF